MAAFQPEFMKEEPIANKHEFKIHIAIDFGTDGTALAYAIGGDEEKVFIHKDWLSSKYQIDVKPKTIILLDENGEVLSFGIDAKQMYISAPKMSDKWMLFERFKMMLYQGDDDCKIDEDNDDEKASISNIKIPIQQELIASNGKRIKSSVVFIAALKHLQQTAKKYLKRMRLRNIEDSDIQWIITVPAIWNDAAKMQMRQWAIDACLVNENIDTQCKIVYEPDCASLSIQYYIQKSKSKIYNGNITDTIEDEDTKSESKNNIIFRKGEKYILVDAGGGTVDISCHQLLGENNEFGVKEVLHPSGGAWGSCYIDDQFVKLLKDIFSAIWMDEFKATKTNYYIELLNNFQNTKESYYTETGVDTCNVRLPFELIGFIQDKLENQEGTISVDIEEMVRESKVFGKHRLVSLSEDYLCIKSEAWSIMFDHVINPTIKHIEDLLNNAKLMRKCRYLCLVGGLSASPYFQFKMKQHFGEKSKYTLSLIIPQRPILSVVEGAAYFGITNNYIKARVLRYTYGRRMAFPESVAKKLNISSAYISENRYMCSIFKKWYVSRCFEVIARKNEEIYVGQIKKNRAWRDKTMGTIRILYSTSENPKIAKDGKLLGKIHTQYNMHSDENSFNITLEFHFYDTIIKTVSYKTSDPDHTAIAYIANYQ